MPKTSRLNADELRELIAEALEDMKAEEIIVLDVRERTLVTDYMIIASGRSDRHVNSIADRVVANLRDQRVGKIAEERSRDWVLLDAGDVITHVMLPEARLLYSLEKFWSAPPDDTSSES